MFFKQETHKVNTINNLQKFNSGWACFKDYCEQRKIKLFIILHPTQKEFINNNYNKNGQILISYFKKNNIDYLLEMPHMKKKYYRDKIHYNLLGQQFLSEELNEVIQKQLIIENQ